jgi:hypothetical protein
VDAVDAEQALNTLATVFAVGSLVVIVFFFRRAMPVSLALLGWWICFTVAFLVFAPGTISGSEDVARWAHEASIAGMVGLVAGGWAGSSLGEPRSSARALVGWATLGAVTGVLLLARFWSLSDVSCHGRVSSTRSTGLREGHHVLRRERRAGGLGGGLRDGHRRPLPAVREAGSQERDHLRRPSGRVTGVQRHISFTWSSLGRC